MSRTLSSIVTVSLVMAGACRKTADTAAPGATPAAEATQSADQEEATAPAPQEPVAEAAEPSEGDGPTFLTSTLFEETVQEHMDEVLACYGQARKAKPSLAGNLLANFVFDGEGKVTKVTAADGSTLTDAKLLACIEEKAQGWGFPKPPRPEGTNMQFPFDLNPA